MGALPGSAVPAQHAQTLLPLQARPSGAPATRLVRISPDPAAKGQSGQGQRARQGGARGGMGSGHGGGGSGGGGVHVELSEEEMVTLLARAVSSGALSPTQLSDALRSAAQCSDQGPGPRRKGRRQKPH
ncbi:hypothetical protein CLOM_g7934 [Closterium sp. NIES-68]|nr:hypothetical protein CLOM_g7934 [Closterium sp. NIES-68]